MKQTIINRGSLEQKVLQTLLKETRLLSGRKQSELSEATGLPQSSVSKYESGERRLDILELRSVCHGMGMSLIDFVQELERRLTEIQE